MESLLLLVAWMSVGALCAVRMGPSGAIPVAIFFGPLWFAVAEDMQPELVPAPTGEVNQGGTG